MTEQEKLPELILIDSSGILHKQFLGRKAAAEKNPNLYPSRFAKGPKDTVVNVDGLYGYLSFYENNILKEFGAERIIHVLDSPNGSSSRKKIYPDYKGNREEKDPDLSFQDSILGDVLLRSGELIAYANEYEADDVIGTLAKQFSKKGKVLIISYDKDMTQLVSDKYEEFKPTISLGSYDSNNKKWIFYDSNETVYKKMGVIPSQVADMLALCGDSADNIPGIFGVGPGKASKLLDEYGTLEGILLNLEHIPKKLGENVRKAIDLLPIYKELTLIKQNLGYDDLVIKTPAFKREDNIISNWLSRGADYPINYDTHDKKSKNKLKP